MVVPSSTKSTAKEIAKTISIPKEAQAPAPPTANRKWNSSTGPKASLPNSLNAAPTRPAVSPRPTQKLSQIVIASILAPVSKFDLYSTPSSSGKMSRC